MEYGHSSCSIGNTLKNPSKASACSQTPYPWAFRLKDWVQESFSWGLECFSRTDLPPILRESFFLKDIFRLKHFTMHILQPECRWAGRLRNGWKIWRKNKAFRHVDTVMGKNNRSNFKKLLFFQWKRPVLFFKDLVLFWKEQDVWEVSNVHAGRLVTCHPIRY